MRTDIVSDVRIKDFKGHKVVLRPLSSGQLAHPHPQLTYTYVVCDVYDLTDDRQEDAIMVFDHAVVDVLLAALNNGVCAVGTVEEVQKTGTTGMVRVSAHLVQFTDEQDADHAMKMIKTLGWDTSTHINLRVGSTIRNLRVAAGRTQEDLAAYLEIAPTGVSDIENGKRAITVETVYNVANFLGVPVRDIYEG